MAYQLTAWTWLVINLSLFCFLFWKFETCSFSRTCRYTSRRISQSRSNDKYPYNEIVIVAAVYDTPAVYRWRREKRVSHFSWRSTLNTCVLVTKPENTCAPSTHRGCLGVNSTTFQTSLKLFWKKFFILYQDTTSPLITSLSLSPSRCLPSYTKVGESMLGK